MDERKKTENSIDAGAASMAYMPGVNGTSEAQESENDLTIDPASEKQTMADIANELAAEDEKAGVKIPIGGKAVPVTAAKASAKATPKTAPKPSRPAPKAAPLEIKDSTIPRPLPEGSTALPVSNTQSTPAKNKGGGGKVILALFLVLALVGAGVLGWLWWSQKSSVTTLEDKITGLESDKKRLTGELETAQSSEDTTPSPVSDSSVRTIPELALTYKLTDATKKVTYSYSEITTSSVAHSVLLFSSTDLIAAERKVVTDPTKYLCTSGDGPLGALTSYKAADTVPTGGKASALAVDGKSTFKLGETYYIFTPAQSTCSTDKTVQASQTAGKALVTELLSTLSR